MMNIKTKLWLYDKTATDYKGTEYTDYIQLGDQNKDTLDETLGGVELTLVGLNFRKEFDPSTKFIWEQYNIVDGQEILIATKHLMVDSDYVSQPILSDDNYFTHHITFLEAAVVAQKRIVDDIAVTYKLKDVNLFGENAINTNAYADTRETENQKVHSGTFHTAYGFISRDLYYGRQFRWEWATWLENSSYPNYATYNANTWDKIYKNIDVKDGNPITISIPMLSIYVGKRDTIQYETTRQGFCAIDVVLTETDISSGQEEVLEAYTINPCSDNATENEWNFSYFDNSYCSSSGYIVLPKGSALNTVKIDEYASGFGEETVVTYKTLAKHTNSYDDRYITFTPQKNKKYTIKVYPHNYTDDNNIVAPNLLVVADNGNSIATDSYSSWVNLVVGTGWNRHEFTYITNETPSATLEFYTYDSSDYNYTLFTSAPPANAYDLFVKAVLCSQDTYKKESGVSITDQETVFYIDDQYVDELKATQIYENTYHQNNLWQLLIEIGKYIHAIPLIKFGDNDRFKISFTRLGVTDETINNNPIKFGIYNHRTMEDYISSTSSYVNNLVQGGGIIQEVVAPKSTSNDYLVYNDVAKLITSKNIIELVRLEVRTITDPDDPTSAVTDWADMTDYVFEKSIYEILPIIPNEPNNKGISVYYTLGTNVIEGFDYILPSVSAGSNDYAIKNILAKVFNVIYDTPIKITNLKVNNFTFRITYRTKDSARVDQTRPDLRKYLLNSTMDYAPLQYQFNNQQDRVLDAQRFGNNIYGKLIKTGNTSFEISEWVEDLGDLKQVGELYRLPEDENNLYYVATVENTNYGSYITSNVTFSKDYNELSNMIGIPSEPRFYEIATENLIQREVSNNNYLVLGSGNLANIEAPAVDNRKCMVYENTGMEYVKDLLFSANTPYPKYAITCFKNDIDNTYGNVSGNNLKYSGILTPISSYSVQNTLNMEYDMVDNLSAGDKVSKDIEDDALPDRAYRTLSAVQYTDAYGRDDMFDMAILKDVTINDDQIRNLPESPYAVSYYNSLFSVYPAYREYTYECDRTSIVDWVNDFETWANANLPMPSTITGNAFYIKTKMKFVDNTFNPPLEYYKYGLINIDIEIVGGVKIISIPQEFIDLYNGEPIGITEQIFNDINKDLIPESECVFSTLRGNVKYDIGNYSRGKILLKDNREIISVNTNIHMVTDSDRFVVSGDLWANKNNNVKLALLRKEVSKIINNKISSLDVIEMVDITPTVLNYGQPSYWGIVIPIITALGSATTSLDNIKGLAMVVDDRIIENGEIKYIPDKYTFVMAKNLGGLNDSQKRENWYIAPKDIWEN